MSIWRVKLFNNKLLICKGKIYFWAEHIVANIIILFVKQVEIIPHLLYLCWFYSITFYLYGICEGGSLRKFSRNLAVSD